MFSELFAVEDVSRGLLLTAAAVVVRIVMSETFVIISEVSVT